MSDEKSQTSERVVYEETTRVGVVEERVRIYGNSHQATLKTGKRMFTRDGRKVGNAVVVCQVNSPIANDDKSYWRVETDFGNSMVLSYTELESLYHLDYEPDESIVRHDLDEWRTSRKKNILDWPIGVSWINCRVTVSGEDFEYQAICLCSFPKLDGKIRYIVEDNGRLFIQRKEQLTFTPPLPPPEQTSMKNG